MLRNAEALFVKANRAGHPFHRKYLWELASAVAAGGGLDEAERLTRQALEIHRRSEPALNEQPAGVLVNPGALLLDPTDAASLASLGTLLLDRGDPEGAAPLLRKAVDIYRGLPQARNPDLVDAERALARCEAALRS
jgi:hypothetical protein